MRALLSTEKRPCVLCGNDSKFTTVCEEDRFRIHLPATACDVCGLVFVNPAPTQEFLNTFYGSRMYQGLYLGTFDANEHENDHSYGRADRNVRFIKEHTTLPEHASVLDIDSAYGGFLITLKRAYPYICCRTLVIILHIPTKTNSMVFSRILLKYLLPKNLILLPYFMFLNISTIQ